MSERLTLRYTSLSFEVNFNPPRAFTSHTDSHSTTSSKPSGQLHHMKGCAQARASANISRQARKHTGLNQMSVQGLYCNNDSVADSLGHFIFECTEVRADLDISYSLAPGSPRQTTKTKKRRRRHQHPRRFEEKLNKKIQTEHILFEASTVILAQCF